MSIENVHKLLALAGQDTALHAEIATASREATAKVLMAIGERRGLAFTLDEALKAMTEIEAARSGTPLSEEALARVSGGRAPLPADSSGSHRMEGQAGYRMPPVVT